MPGTSKHLPTRPSSAEGDADREATIESLLLRGLDAYFDGDCERAIHAWTRVLFIDRGHARARAYIERARAVLAERQRESDELLHGAMAAFDRGDAAEARSLLASVMQRGGTEEQALALLQRIDRLDRAGALPLPAGAAIPEPVRAAAREPASRARGINRALLVTAGVILVAAFAVVFGRDLFDGGPARTVPAGAAPRALVPDPPLPVPPASDLRLARARALFARGHLHEALRAIDGVDIGDPRKPDIDRLRADIQRALLSGVAPGDAVAPVAGAAARP